MGEIIHNKLVRDKIPEIIQADDASAITRQLDDELYKEALYAKLCEEANEVKESAGELGEYADVLSVLKAAVSADGFTWEQLVQAEVEKTAVRGGFEKKIFLEKVITQQGS